ncbi:substrate import-associated zinc metallohydrolase lipoprotein [Solitalea lacus]|uniref:substrate import-associated zinc metallohydrolase lipoprotein n=1 Tax=Solitalea lacus TaxID=2911172 RepID=UPI001EDAB12D|nr:substrate import-associated zinc metallohydrolase lipoprotein [Solitalea lacus]UKJ09249.1 putative zinc-binding metallopeptidase [Solitalea lacus]
MKRFHIIFSLLVILAVAGCKKDEIVDFKFNKDLDYTPTDFDKWLTENFLDPANIEVVYRYDRYKDDVYMNLTPPTEAKAKEQMIQVLDLYLMPYQNAAGKIFISKYAPKQWVLSGSWHYDPNDGSRILGISTGGRNITLYEVNTINSTDIDGLKARLKTIHHEFSHTLTQVQLFPEEFQNISLTDYVSDWRSTFYHPDKENDSLGFISRYSRSSFIEDFAETAGFLISHGQLWYDNKAKNCPKNGYDKLKRKEAAVVNFWRDKFGVDFRKLQREVAYSLYNNYNDKSSQSLEYWLLNQGLFVKDLSLNTAAYSSDIRTRVEAFKAAVLAYSTVSKYTVQDLVFMFNPTGNSLIVRVPYKSGTAPVSNADYNFTYSLDPVTHKITFTKAAQGTGATYTNANMFMTSFMANISNYLTSSTFIMDWSIGKGLTRRDEGYFTSGGIYRDGELNSYINFPLVKITK